MPGEEISPFHSPTNGNKALASDDTVFLPLPKFARATPTPPILLPKVPLVSSTNCIGSEASNTAK